MSNEEQDSPHHVVIVGGGFAGLRLAKELASNSKKPEFNVTLIDKRNFHLFQPMLYQVATCILPSSNIATPLRQIVGQYKNMLVLNGKVIDIDPEQKKVILSDEEFHYDTLVVATGVRENYFGNDHWHEFAPGLKTPEEAKDIRRKILLAFEIAERHPDPEVKEAWMRFVVVGGGPTGVELSGAIGELAHHTLAKEFKNIDPRETEVLLIEAADRILQPFHPKLSQSATKSLQKLGVTVRTNTMVTDVHKNGMTIKSGDKTEEIQAKTILWAAGVKGSALGEVLAKRAGCELDRAGRVKVESDCTIPNHDDIFVLGDLAHFTSKKGTMVPGVATAAIQQGAYLAKLLRARQKGKTVRPFKYLDKGSMAIIGKYHAVVQMGKIRLTGTIACLIWAFIHILYLVGFGNRFVVCINWLYFFLNYKRGVRLILGDDAYHLIEEDSLTPKPIIDPPESKNPTDTQTDASPPETDSASAPAQPAPSDASA